MTEKQANPLLKLGLEIGPIIAFFLAYRWAPVAEGATETEAQLAQILFATKVFIPLILISLALSWVLTKHLPKMAVVTAIMVVVFGGLTLWLQDATFIKMKPTILYACFAAALGFGLMRGQSYLKLLMGEMIPMSDAGWMKFTFRFALFFAALAVANEVVWRMMSTDAWVNFKTFVLPVVTFGFVASQIGTLSEHSTEDESAKDK